MNENILKTIFLLTLLTCLMVLFGAAFGGGSGALTAFLFACAINFASYWFSDAIVLSIYRAQPLDPGSWTGVHESVRELADEAGLPMPKLYRIPSAAANAFATGRDPAHASLALTEGILELLSPEELKGVVAHELSHVKHYDILIASLAATLAGAVTLMADWARWMFFLGGHRSSEEREDNPLVLLLMAFLMPIAAVLIQLAISRSREYDADREGGRMTKNPLYLASALQRIDAHARQIPMREIQPASAHLFIHHSERSHPLQALFSTHPPLEERLARLEAQARAMGL
ncbi:MAG: zinc metalloprotease HtpX [Candidatus Omnitrophota bacterium]